MEKNLYGISNTNTMPSTIAIITFSAEKELVGQFADVRVTKALNWVLEGEKV